MGRNRKTSKAAGTRLETQMERWLQWAFQDARIRRLRLHGHHDEGDIGNLFYSGDPVCIECKATANSESGAPLNVRYEFEQALTEADNIDSPWPVLIKKRDGVTDRDWRKGGDQLGIIRRSDWLLLRKNCATPLLPQSLVALPRNPRLIGMPCTELFILFNHGLPLGPEEE